MEKKNNSFLIGQTIIIILLIVVIIILVIGGNKKNGNIKISIDADELLLNDFTAEFNKKYKIEGKRQK